jgi:transaldolase
MNKQNSQLDQLKAMTTVVADTGDLAAIKAYNPVDATTNPSLVLKAAALPDYRELLMEALIYGQKSSTDFDAQLEHSIEKLSVNIGCEILKHVPGRVSTEVSARYSFDQNAIIASAERLIGLYEAAGYSADRVLIKTAATWEGINAAKVLEQRNIQCNLTLLFGFGQAAACADAGVYLISPFVGRILDWYKASTGRDSYPIEEDPGVASVARIFNYYKHHGYQTIVMGASFRSADQVRALGGCDRLTISPQLLDELKSSHDPLPRLLDPNEPKGAEAKLEQSEGIFRWHLNEDAMATEKLAEGIRNFYADELKLRTYLQKLEAEST